MGKYRRLAIRLAIYIKALGGEPATLEGPDFRVHVALLERQYIELRQSVEPEAARAAKLAARAKIQTQTLLITAAGLIPSQPPAPTQSTGNVATHQEAITDTPAAGMSAQTEEIRRSRWKIKREKLEAFFARPDQTVLKCPKCRMRCGFPKKSYPAKNLAEDAKRRSRGGRGLVVYECHCQPGYWHLGHSQRKK